MVSPIVDRMMIKLRLTVSSTLVEWVGCERCFLYGGQFEQSVVGFDSELNSCRSFGSSPDWDSASKRGTHSRQLQIVGRCPGGCSGPGVAFGERGCVVIHVVRGTSVKG